jgi:hypothetical protein
MRNLKVESTLLYFFSTLTQAFAAIVAFVYVAAQSRIAWLDSKITSEKMALLFKLNPGTPKIGFYMATRSATQTINDGLAKNEEAKAMAEQLKGSVQQMQDIRNAIRTHIIWGIGIVMLGIVGIVSVPLIKDCNLAAWGVLLVSAGLALFSAYQTGKFACYSLKVSLKESV